MNVDSRKQIILIVDDEEEVISSLTKLLQQDFYIKKALTSDAALSIAFSEQPPDLILMDTDMPLIDGYEICKRLKQSSQTKSIPVILLAEKMNETDELYRFNSGAVDYIQKPFHPLTVRSRVSAQAELKKHRDYLEELSYSDSLTGIYNRKKFNEFLELSWSYAKREDLSVTLILMDIDCFRQYNEHYGHQAGDSCLT